MKYRETEIEAQGGRVTERHKERERAKVREETDKYERD